MREQIGYTKKFKENMPLNAHSYIYRNKKKNCSISKGSIACEIIL